MASPAKQASSRWGSFLSQAVAGVEAKLDTILADDYDDTAQQSKESKPAATPPPAASPAKASPTPSRTASTRTNDRLQERLARAMAAKAAGKNIDRTSSSTPASPRQSLDAPSRASTDSVDRPNITAKDSPKAVSSPRASLDTPRKSQDTTQEPPVESGSSVDGTKEVESQPVSEKAESVRVSTDQPRPENTAEVETPKTEAKLEAPAEIVAETEPKKSVEVAEKEQPNGQDTKSDDTRPQNQDEIHDYIERIDALEAKLQYLAREASAAARREALSAPAGSAERKLAEKDQQIAQLMEEGKNLASNEQKLRTILKNLRKKQAEDEKEIGNLKTAKEKADREIENLRKRARHSDELEKSQNELQRRLDQSQRELNNLRPEVKSKDAIIAELRSQLQKATEQADAMSAKVNDKAREQDQRRIAELEESVEALKIEKNLVADRAKTQTDELRKEAERASEKAKAVELELKAEVQVMESKLEAMRTRAEEASSGVTGDSQAKLLRQVETLQSQYSIASENWQGIETTLRSRIVNLEKERDEALQRESDMRRKAREAALRARRNEEELEEAKTKLTNQEDVESHRSQLESLKKRAEEAEAALAQARADFEKQKQAWEAEREVIKEERQRDLQAQGNRPRSWLEGLPGGPFLKNEGSGPGSPQLSTAQRTYSTDYLGIQGLSNKVRKASAPSSNGDAAGAIASRRPSGQPGLIRTSVASGSTQPGSNSLFSPTAESMPPVTPLSAIHPPSDAGAAPEIQHPPRELHRSDTGFDSIDSSSSPHNVMQDMVSVSTIAAGPSVQLVERMSAKIRQLESEKVTVREELARISKQRDEARAEIVVLMGEVENQKKAGERVAELERQVAEVNERYETTLELLGEKSEEVDELKADVADLKDMYRDLVERTMR
ncbi:TATA element modulatory factor 1 TATA binding-domain-containing protein [Copromyces sp. CBS 386.78]|nr:TATA element modulatory factor 1 TATA binding-domain-containing protein [Copromyces sp. CBS 386.78]